MIIEVQGIQEKGNQKEEYVSLKALEACNLKYYIVTDTTFTSDLKSISNKMRHMYWFKSKEVAKGDFVRLWTGQGTDNDFTNKSGTTTHNIYWGLKTPIWNNDGDGARLFEVNSWAAKKA